MREKIAVRELSAFFKEKQLLGGVNLTIRKGELTALIGPSGSGKSTFLKCLDRMTDEEEITVKGSVQIDGEEILTDRVDLPALRKKVGMVFQTPALFPGSIFYNAAYGVRLHERLPRRLLTQRVEDALQKAGLLQEVKDRLSSPASSLSGGQQQRLCIARALAVQPEVLLLDEPTSALDPVSCAQIESLLCEIKQSVTPVMVTHNLAQARRIADACAFFSEKTVLQWGNIRLLDGIGACRALQKYLSV